MAGRGLVKAPGMGRPPVMVSRLSPSPRSGNLHNSLSHFSVPRHVVAPSLVTPYFAPPLRLPLPSPPKHPRSPRARLHRLYLSDASLTRCCFPPALFKYIRLFTISSFAFFVLLSQLTPLSLANTSVPPSNSCAIRHRNDRMRSQLLDTSCLIPC